MIIRVESDEQFHELRSRSVGFFLTYDKNRQRVAYPMLHKTKCPRLQSEEGKNYTSNEYRKVFSTTLAELHNWVRQNDSRELKVCKICLTPVKFSMDEKDIATLPLSLYEDYSRQDVQRLFAPSAAFTVGAGTWGILGIVRIPNRPGDFVFLVTLGQEQGAHKFDEGVTVDGVLSWQSQPKQSLTTHTIQQLITHDELRNTIYLFLRTDEGKKYTYLGTLKYLTHDTERERPVYFQWQILQGAPPAEVCSRINLVLQTPTELGEALNVKDSGLLQEIPRPARSQRSGTRTIAFRRRKFADYSQQEAKNRTLGLAGELLVIKHEKESLKSLGRQDLAEKIVHVALTEGDSAGYDILVPTIGFRPKFLEVKTTCGGADTPFFMTSNEVAFAKLHTNNYVLYRVFDYDPESNSGMFFKIEGSIEAELSFTPTEFRVSR